jgi:L,D-transpeptidase ErfK/SrfK
MTKAMRNSIKSILVTLMVASNAHAATILLQPSGIGASQSVVGEVQLIVAKYEDTLSDLGRRYGIGYEEMIAANPGVDPWLPGEGTRVVVPSQFILPDAPREGIVINLPEHRLYYFPPTKVGQPQTVVTYPISVGKMDWNTPLGLTRIVDKRVKPTWTPPESVHRERAEDGRPPLPRVVPPGPDNPLGEYAMRLAIPGGAYLIHGTNKPIAVGMPVTHGCIRMFPEDIEEFFKMVPVNTRVRILHQPYKAGFIGDQLYMEVHPPLTGHEDPDATSLTNITRVLVAATQDRNIQINWSQAELIFKKASGVPEALRSADAIIHTAEAQTIR